MSRIGETKRAYKKLADLLDQEIRNRKGNTNDLEEFRKTLDVAFYLLGWGQFEYMVRKEAAVIVEEKSRLRDISGHAWQFVQENIKGLTVRERLNILFHGDTALLAKLHKDYSVRNEAAHDNKPLPVEARDLEKWLEHLEDIVDEL